MKKKMKKRILPIWLYHIKEGQINCEIYMYFFVIV